MTKKEQQPLHIAETPEQVEEALAKGGELEALNKRGETALYSACERGNLPVVDCLLNHGAKPEISKGSLVCLAAKEGFADIMERLVKAGASIDEKSGGSTALLLASRIGWVDVVERAISLGANPNIVDRDENTALMVAIENDKVDVVDLLLAAGCDVNYGQDVGLSAVVIAADAGKLEMLDRLMIHGADLNVVDTKEGCTPLMKACRTSKFDTAKKFIDLGCNLDVQDFNGWTALMWASTFARLEIVNYLILNKANHMIQDRKNKRAIDMAGSFEVYNSLKGLFSFPFCPIDL